MKTKLALSVCATAYLLTGCVNFAPPSPLATLGGPATTARGASEVGIAAGGGLVSSDSGSGSGNAALVRYRYGVTDRLDLGIDALYVRYGRQDAVTVKAAGRYALSPNWRLELGLGAADSSHGRSTNGDLGITWGTRLARPWNYYTSLRFGAAHGANGNWVFGFQRAGDDVTLPDARFGLLSAGMQRTLPGQRRFVWEAGIGALDNQDKNSESALMYYLCAGVLFDFGKGAAAQ